MSKLVASLLGALLLVGQPAFAQTAPAPAAATPAPALKSRLDQLVALLNGTGDYAGLFAPVFRQAVPQGQLQTYIDQLRAQGGRATCIESIAPMNAWQATATVGYERLVATVQIAVDPVAPHQVTGLRITGAVPRGDNLAKLEADFRKLPGASGFGTVVWANAVAAAHAASRRASCRFM